MSLRETYNGVVIEPTPEREIINVRGMEMAIDRIPCKVAKDYITKNHYSHGCHNGPSPNYGLFNKDGELIGVCMFATPCSENVRSSIFGKGTEDMVIELHRLHILDCTPINTESCFVTHCLKLLKNDKPRVKAVISFSDTTQGHQGTIYQACDFYFIGKTTKATFYSDETGRLRHPRQNGVNISLEEAAKRGWKPTKRLSKNRYLFILAKSKVERKKLMKMCQYKLKTQTKEDIERGDGEYRKG